MSEPRVLYVDAQSGAAGDMILGALVGLGVPLTLLRRGLQTLPLPGWTLSSRRVRRAGLTARKIHVRVAAHEHGRGWREIRRIVEGGRLEPEVRRRALGIFRRLIEAEAEVHGLAVDKVHLHEAGGTDAIVDIVGACLGLARLEPQRIVVSPLTTGFGRVRCAHGLYPVPAPATTLLIRGVPVQAGEIEVERLTPTGAAILTSIADAWGALPPMKPDRVGYGAGGRDLGEDPNFLRMILGDLIGKLATPEEDPATVVLEFSVDDAAPQVLAYAAERLFHAGALEVYTTPIHMKKGRTGQLVTALARSADLATLAGTILRETTTFGLRYRHDRRIELDRRILRVRTAYGPVRIKEGSLSGEVVQAWPEYEDCAALARRQRVPLKEVQQAALQAYRSGAAKPGVRKRRKEP